MKVLLSVDGSVCSDAAVQEIAPVEIMAEQKMGHAPSTILDEAEAWSADLIVVGSHGYRGFKRFLLGSVAQALASHARCSVAIMRQRQDR